MAEMKSVAIVGAGLVGLGWAIVFARAGLPVRIFDADASTRAGALQRLKSSLADMAAADLVSGVDDIMRRFSVVDRLADAVEGADYVQESVFERVDIKTEVSEAIGPLLGDTAVVGSSSSGIPASDFTANVRNRERFLIAHPVNPPQLVPLVELVPAPWTNPAVVPRLKSFMTSLGQVPIVVNREIEGFILNRLQGALLNEAWALFADGYATAEDIDRTVAHGLGLRWSFMGPFETIDLNAPGGVADYARRLGPLYHGVASSRSTPRVWDEDLIARVTSERRQALPLEDLGERSAWRDRRLMALVRHKRTQPTGQAQMTDQILAGKVAAVTGGSGGIGSAICRRLADAGARVFIGYNTAAQVAEDLCADLPGSGHVALPMPVTQSDAMKVAADAMAGAGVERLDLLVNCAGATRFVPHDDLDGLDDALISHILDVNVRGVIVAVRAFLPLLRAFGGGTIVNISSIAGVTAMGSNIAYCASKAAVDNLTKSLARALAPTVRVLSVSPGLVATEFVRGLDERWREEQARRTLLGRLAYPEEVADSVVSAAAHMSFMTGAILPVDGGRQLS